MRSHPLCHKTNTLHVHRLPIYGPWPESKPSCFFFVKNFKGLVSTEAIVETLGPTHRIVLQFPVVHVNDVGTDTIQEVLGM